MRGRRLRGFTLIEVSLALSVGMTLITGSLLMMGQVRGNLKLQEIVTQFNAIATQMPAYLETHKTNRPNVMAFDHEIQLFADQIVENTPGATVSSRDGWRGYDFNGTRYYLWSYPLGGVSILEEDEGFCKKILGAVITTGVINLNEWKFEDRCGATARAGITIRNIKYQLGPYD
ncbi:type II secretion system protein [Paracoccus litorisediminis]|uniref:type II secretion system protein n=1 Tax=Paracoccus litorisediminis TaxID=2006130 RepID=UPI0037342159